MKVQKAESVYELNIAVKVEVEGRAKGLVNRV